MGKSGNLLDLTSSSGETAENCTDISTLLHRNDPKLIFLINPNEESLLIVVEDASSLWPISVEAACIKESISFFEKEVVVNQLLPLSICHRSKRVESSSELSIKGSTSLDNLLFNLISLFSRNSRSKWVFSQVTANSDAS